MLKEAVSLASASDPFAPTMLNLSFSIEEFPSPNVSLPPLIDEDEGEDPDAIPPPLDDEDATM